MRIHILVLFIIIVPLILLSCGRSDSVQTDPTGTNHSPQWFWANPDDMLIFSGAQPMYDADISEILQGPGNDDSIEEGFVWQHDNRHFAVAVALEEIEQSPDRTMSYRFLGDAMDLSDKSDILPVLDDNDDPIQGNIRFARIASCYIRDHTNPNSTSYTFVEVSIIYQIEFNGQWDIRICRMGFDPDDFADIASINGPAWVVVSYNIVADQGYDDIMPDIAYDPRCDYTDSGGGDLYFVFSRYVDDFHAYIHLGQGVRHNPQQSQRVVQFGNIAERIQFSLMNGFHPRMDIGYIGFPDLLQQWKIGIAFTGDRIQVDEELVEKYHTRLIVDTVDDPFEPIEVGLRFPPYANTAGGMPTIDIGPPDADHAAIAWTQSRSPSWNDCTVGFLDTKMHQRFFDIVSGNLSSASPSVAVHSGIGLDVYRTSVSYLLTTNPNSTAWNPRARHCTSTWVGPGEWDYDISNPMEINDLIHGEFDSGSQYTNWYGMNTSLTVAHNRYWMLWSSTLTGQDGLNQVHGTFGYTE